MLMSVMYGSCAHYEKIGTALLLLGSMVVMVMICEEYEGSIVTQLLTAANQWNIQVG